MYRTKTCGELNITNVNETIELAGWIQKIRDLGAMIFIDLRDQFGITQIVINDEKMQEEAKSLKEKLEKETITFKVRTGEGDRVFGSISAKQIKDELQKKGYKIEKSMIKLDIPISSLGFHNVDILLYQDVIATIKIHVIK